MKGHAERTMFSERELVLLREAQRIVEALPAKFDKVRCHELARGVGQLLGLKFVDGQMGIVQHTWLWTSDNSIEESDAWENGPGWFHEGRPNILDVYRPGIMPQVALIDTWGRLPYWRTYEVGSRRTDIDKAVVDGIVDVGRVR